MHKRALTLTILLIVVGLVLPSVVVAQQDDEPIVHAVLFFSPTCPHCHQVINELLVPMLEQYGDQLQIAGIDTSQSGGARLYQAAVEHFQIPQERRGVPMLVVNDTVLVGSSQIPDQFPNIVQEGLGGKGIDWPDIPGLAEALSQAEQAPQEEQEPTPEPTSPPTASPVPPVAGESENDAGICQPGQEDCEDDAPTIDNPSAPATDMVRLTDDGIVRLVFFWSVTCSHCHEVMEQNLPSVIEKYGERLEIAYVETSDPAHYEVYLSAIDLYNVPPERQGVPALYIGDTHLSGSFEIPRLLDGLVQHYLDQGGIDYPPLPGLEAVADQAPKVQSPETASSPSEAGETKAQPIHLAYFYQTGCQDCDRVKGDLDYLKTKYPQLAVEDFNVRDNAALSEWLGERAGVPESHRLTAPTVFAGDDYLLEKDLDARSLEALLEKYTPDGAERIWENWEKEAGTVAQKSIVERFKSLGVFTVVFAGLVDGLNPCAFATLIFFVSYLSLSGRKGKEILSVGAAFTFGVFIAYMLVGLGFYRALDLLGDLLTTLGRWVYGLTAAFCLILAVVSFLDYLKARRGEIGDMALNLPHRLRMQINATIRKTRKSQTFVAAAFVTGIIVSFLELACTGQVYLPTIIFVMSVPELKAQAVLFLLIYNLLFVAPLIVVFILAYYGTGAKQLTGFLQQRASTVKLGLSVLFLALGGWLAISLI